MAAHGCGRHLVPAHPGRRRRREPQPRGLRPRRLALRVPGLAAARLPDRPDRVAPGPRPARRTRGGGGGAEPGQAVALRAPGRHRLSVRAQPVHPGERSTVVRPRRGRVSMGAHRTVRPGRGRGVAALAAQQRHGPSDADAGGRARAGGRRAGRLLPGDPAGGGMGRGPRRGPVRAGGHVARGGGVLVRGRAPSDRCSARRGGHHGRRAGRCGRDAASRAGPSSGAAGSQPGAGAHDRGGAARPDLGGR